jgi:hypothetical protein
MRVRLCLHSTYSTLAVWKTVSRDNGIVIRETVHNIEANQGQSFWGLFNSILGEGLDRVWRSLGLEKNINVMKRKT